MNKNKALHDIANQIVEHLDGVYNLNYGLLGGDFGEIIFLYYYSRIDSSYEEKADELLGKMISTLNDSYYKSSYCNGLAGLGIGLNLLEDAGYINGANDALDNIDLLLEYLLNNDLKNNKHDFLHGFIGIGFYFLMRYKQNERFSLSQIIKIVSYLQQTAIIENDTIKWKLNDDLIKYNISLSHGMSSTVIFLSEILTLNITSEQRNIIIPLINGAINYILKQQLDVEKYGSWFPSFSKEYKSEHQKSRLAWCYGDLGIAVALRHVGINISDNKLVDISTKIFEDTAIRRLDLVNNFVSDAALCHGSAGIAQIFLRMYKYTNNPIYNDAYEFWKKSVFDMIRYRNGNMITFQTYNPETKEWEDKTSLLDGIAGIGLFLLPYPDSEWDRLLLL